MNNNDLMIAVFCGTARQVAEVLARGNADVNEAVNGGLPLTVAANRQDFEMVKLLLDHGADPNRRDDGGIPAIYHAVVHADERLFGLLCERGADVQAIFEVGNLVAVATMWEGKHTMIPILAARGVDPNVFNTYGETPLILAAAYGCKEAILELLKVGALAGLPDRMDGWTPLQHAVHNGFEECANLLRNWEG